VSGPEISLEPYYLTIRTKDGEKPVPYHRILLITYDGEATFENRKIQGQANQLIEESQDIADHGIAGTMHQEKAPAVDDTTVNVPVVPLRIRENRILLIKNGSF